MPKTEYSYHLGHFDQKRTNAAVLYFQLNMHVMLTNYVNFIDA